MLMMMAVTALSIGDPILKVVLPVAKKKDSIKVLENGF